MLVKDTREPLGSQGYPPRQAVDRDGSVGPSYPASLYDSSPPDAPWCSITTSHASHAHLPQPGSPLLLEKVNKPEKHKTGAGVKGRMEPCEVPIIAQVIANVKGISLEEVAHAAWSNTLRLFYPEEITSTP